MKDGKRFILIICILLSLLIGCSNETESNAYPNKPITLINPYSAGGPSSIGARMVAAELEKVLGVPVNVVDTPGASGWIGWTDLLNADKDGYTIANFNTPPIISGYLDPNQNRDKTLEDFEPIFCYVLDYATISVNPNETRFTNLEELIEYAKVNEVTATTTGANTDEHISMAKMNDAFGTKFIPVHNSGESESLTSIMGGHVDVMFGNVGGTKVPAGNGQVKTLAVMAPERSKLMPEIPTVKEITGIEVVNSAGRGIGVAAGTPQEVYDVLYKAFEEVGKSEELKEKMNEQGLDFVSIMGEDYVKLLKDEEAAIKKVAPLLGWQ